MVQRTSATWLTHRTAPGLPAFSAYWLPSDNSPVLIKRGERCYYPAPDMDPDQFNFNHGVTRVQAEAMFWGASCGWHVPGADPANYGTDGTFIHGGGENDAQ